MTSQDTQHDQAAERLTHIEARDEAATPGPWMWRGNIDFGDPYLASRPPGRGVHEVMGHIPVERSENDYAIQSLLDLTEEDEDAALHEYLYDGYGEFRTDQQLVFNVSGTLREARQLPVFEVCREATNRADSRVYRADVVGIRHPDAEFIAYSRRDVSDLVALARDVLAVVEKYKWDDASEAISADIRDAFTRCLGEQR